MPDSAADPSTPNLLEFASLDPAPAPSSVVKNDKKEEDAVKPAPAVVEAPAPISALVPSSSPPVEAAPAPAPAGDPVQLATTGDDQNNSSPASAPKPPPKSLASESPQPPSTTGETANAAVKPTEARAPAEPKTVMNPPDAHKTEPGPQTNPAISQPESTPSELVKSEPPKSKNDKVEEPPPASLGHADNLKAEPKTVLNPPDAHKTAPGPQTNPASSQPESTPSELVKSEPPKSKNDKVEEPAPASLGPADNLKAEPKTVMNPPDAHKTEPGPQTNPAISQPESTPNELVKSEPPNPKNAKDEKPAPVALGHADNLKVAPVFPATPGVHVSGSEGAVTAKPPVESSAAPLETPAAAAHNTPSQPTIPAPEPVKPAPPHESQVQIPDSSSQVPDSSSPIPDSRSQVADSSSHVADSSSQAAESQPQISATKEPDARPRSSRELASAGWVSVPNSGKILFEDATNADAPRDASGSGAAAESAAMRDAHAHAAKDVSFELESPRASGTAELEQNSRRSVLGSGAATEPKSSSTAGRVEPNAHVVEKTENFWSISRLYYSSGRYYRALWKANADKYPKIDKLKVNDVIMIPAVEDLDPAYIDPPRARAPASLGTARNSGDRSAGSTRDNADGQAESSVSPSADARGEPISTARTNRGSGDAIPVRRSSRTAPDLDLPAPEAISRRDNAPDRTGRRVDRPLGDDDANDASETRTAARPRATAVASKRRPVYKIRKSDTLRTIARDMLGDSHRSSEILDLNRDLIDDPAHLIVGQVLELPDDARTSVRRSASR